ncbi:MAG: response regulator transcription factor [Alphaproteobacteria bacterium]|nr:response regulator transcription factor [Alphaproteobacteria bacterium]MBU1513268.1 response regulator transcription factor [Alphaproteobacteria bacterium]MBU2093612.1 response regulator transcription factor [Alphaproteobacteria bacterium]MBU2151944.1 response regulator transcription factor [Alphaproteobacteria bacterium]MBU2307604.1 response regulator transcription factor [Alphaproteobacteria bacterium]
MRGLICDDHPLMREALSGAIRDRWPDLTVEEAGDYPTAWACAEAQPDFCLVDLAMPGADPVAGISGLRARAPDAALVVITGLADKDLLAEVRACGVAGVFSKNAPTELMLEAIRAVVPGLQALEVASLPPRQREVLVLLGKGLTNKEIGLRLGISPATVKIHVARTISWLGAVNRTDAVARAQRARII